MTITSDGPSTLVLGGVQHHDGPSTVVLGGVQHQTISSYNLFITESIYPIINMTIITAYFDMCLIIFNVLDRIL